MVVVVVVGEYRAKKGRDDDGRSQKRFHGQSPPVSVALLGKRRCPMCRYCPMRTCGNDR
jgi:hypothetical protein